MKSIPARLGGLLTSKPTWMNPSGCLSASVFFGRQRPELTLIQRESVMASKRSSRAGPRRAVFLPVWRARKRSSTASGNRRLLFENLEQRVLLAADWQNSLNRLDISDNGVVTPFDALTVINELNLRRISDGTGQLPPRPPNWPPGELIDADGSGSVSPFDALLVINALNGDRQPPTLTAGLLADTAPHGTFNSDGVTSSATITGQVHDALTGVASLQAQIDRGHSSS